MQVVRRANHLWNTPPPNGKRRSKKGVPQTGNAKPGTAWLHQSCGNEEPKRKTVGTPQHQEMNRVRHVCTCAEGEKDHRTDDLIVVAF